MRLVPISENVLVNPDCIECLEQRDMGGVSVMWVWVCGRDYVLNVPLEQFYKSIEDNRVVQNFAG